MRRFLLILIIFTFTLAASAQQYSGSCGASLTWSLNTTTRTLTISGSGPMTEYGEWNKAPWYRQRSYIRSVSLPEGMTTIGGAAFMGCSNLQSVSIPSTVTAIKALAFYGSGITTVTIPAAVTYIHHQTFADCANLTTINVATANTKFVSYEGILFNKDTTTLVKYPGGKLNTFYTIPDGVTTVGSEAFRACKHLLTINIASSVSNFGRVVNCPNLSSYNVNPANNNYRSINGILFSYDTTELVAYPQAKAGLHYTIPPTVKTLKNSCFYGSKNMETITIPASVTTIETHAFWAMQKIIHINIPASVTTIEHAAFSTPKLASIDVDTNNANYCSVNGILYTKDTTTLMRFPCAHPDTIFTIPSSVTLLEYSSMSSAKNLTRLTIPSSVTQINEVALNNCSRLMSINIPASVTYIGSSAFQGCIGLLDIVMNTHFPPIVGTDVFYDSYDKILAVPCGARANYQSDAIYGQFSTIIEQCNYNVTALSDSLEQGTTAGSGIYMGGSIIDLTAIPSHGHEFLAWADGDTNNPRTILVRGDTNFTATFYNLSTIENPIGDEGNLPGWFSISDTNKVSFSQGNLRYRACDSTWLFSEHQYDVIGSGNTNIDPSYTGWIDLFGWGTGDNPTLCSSNNYDYSTFVDWGDNAITNGGDSAYLWRTLSNEEMVHIFRSRPNAAQKFGAASIAGHNGIVVLPDNWRQPSGLSFTPGMAARGANFASVNSYTLSQWGRMEANGAVFLPQGGHRNTTTFLTDGWGAYQTSTPKAAGSGYAHAFIFYNADSLVMDVDYCNKRFGQSVRLVRDVPRYTVTLGVNNATGGTVTGGGRFFPHDTTTLTATPATEYAFTGWSDGNTLNPRILTVDKDSTITASFVYLGHTWMAPTYQWNSDSTQCTARHLCANDTTHQESETATTLITRTEPTCSANGSISYVATFNHSAFTTQVAVVILPMLPSSSYENDTAVCDRFYGPDGTIQTVRGDYIYHITNHFGCDSTITVHLTVNHGSDTTLTLAANGKYTWIDGVAHTTSGTFTHTLENHVGCDSIITLNLTIREFPLRIVMTDKQHLLIHHYPQGRDNKRWDYLTYRWFHDDVEETFAVGKDYYSTLMNGGGVLDGSYYVMVPTDSTFTDWMMSNVITAHNFSKKESDPYHVWPSMLHNGGLLHIDSEVDVEEGTRCLIYDMKGMMHQCFIIDNKATQTAITLPSGTYMVMIQTPSNRYTYKIVVL